MTSLTSLFCYCGVSKKEYESVKRDAYISNFHTWKFLHVFISIYFIVLSSEAITYSGLFSVSSILRIALLVYSATISVLFFTKTVKEDSLLGQLIIYLTMIILLVITFWYGLIQSDMMAVSFTVMLVTLSMFMIDKPYFMAIVLFIASTAFLIHARFLKSAEAFHGDLVNVIAYGLLGIVINTFYNSIRVREFLLSKRSRRLIREQKQSMDETGKLNNVLQKMSISLIESLGEIVESRDSDSGDHIRRVKGYTYLLAANVMENLPEYNLDKYTVNLMTFASALHDVGKISISDTILLKPGRLTKEEFDIMKTHCEKGCEILEKMRGSWSREYLDMALAICGSHHEKWDGKGYPKGLKGDEIPIAAQIVSIADVYDALTTKRVYKDAYSCDEAFRMIMEGECGVYSDKLLACLRECADAFRNHHDNPAALALPEYAFEVTSTGNGADQNFVIGIHDQDHTLRENVRMAEELSVINTLSERFCYVCYVDMKENEVYRFKADENFRKIIDTFDQSLPSNKRLDKLLNTIIISEDYAEFKRVTHREEAIARIKRHGNLVTDFRIRLEDGIHHIRMRINMDPNDKNAVILGMKFVDDEYAREEQNIALRLELEKTKKNAETAEVLQDRLAVINAISDDYDYVCSLNADNMGVTVYRAEAWIRDMFKNLESIVTDPDVRNNTLKGIIHPDDFETFKESSIHENVMKNLAQNGGNYHVDYRAYKYGTLVHYQTRYSVDKTNPRRIIIGLHSIDDYFRGN